MPDPIRTTEADLPLSKPRKSPLGGLVQAAPGPDAADERDKAGAQAGMAIALVAGSAFWAAVGAVAIYVLRH